MANVLPHRRLQVAAAAGFGAEGEAIGRRVLSGATLTAAQELIVAVLVDSGAGPIGEAAGDVRTLRTNGGFNGPLEKDLATSMFQLTKLMLQSMEHGFTSEAAAQADQIKGLSVTVSEQDRTDMRDYPIQGHTCAEISRYMHDALRYEVTGYLASPLVGDSNVEALPALLADTVRRFSDKCSAAVEEAYFAGTQMAIRAIAVALGVVPRAN